MEKYTESDERDVVSALAHCFYTVLPLETRTFCSFTSRVARESLRRFGFKWDLVPCQLWYAGPEKNHVVGFVGRKEPGKWDGHVICASHRWIFDSSVHHLHQFGVEAPDIIAGPRFNIRSQSIARHDLRTEERLWWLHPPSGMEPNPPEEPPEFVNRYATALCERAKQRLAERVAATASRY